MGKPTRARKQREAAQISTNALTTITRSRMAAFMGYSHEGNRDLYRQFGYSRTMHIGELAALYERSELASRIIRAYPQATWRDHPRIGDERGDSAEKMTKAGKANPSYSPFADAFWEFTEKHNVFHVLERLDRLSSIGRFGILVMGFADGQTDMSQPLSAGNHKLTYLAPHSEANVTVGKWETNTTSPRFGQPLTYRIQNIAVDGGPVGPVRPFEIHHTRTIHISEFLDSDEVFGQPRLKPVANRLMDLEKVIGGGAETFWLTANRGMLINADKDANFSEEAKAAVKSMAEEYQEQLRRILVGQGLSVQSLGSDTPDAEMYVEKLLDLIAGGVGIPKRILVGSERGELASSQDETNWTARIEERRKNFAIPRILKPFVQKMIDTGNLPKPAGRFFLEWQKHVGIDPLQQAQIAASKASAIATFANSPGAELVVPRQEFRRDILGLEPESEFEPEEEEPIDEEDPNLQDPAPGAEDPAEPAESEEDEPKEPETNASKPRSLYVSRKVLNVGPIKKWAKAQGFESVEDDLHVTVVYSRKPIDWMSVPQDYPTGPDHDGSLMIPAGGPRVVEEIGPGRYEVVDGVLTKVGQAVALLFTNADLAWRHQRIIECGAEHGFADFQPHITITWSAGNVDLSKVEPYQGAIALGPEIFAEIEE